MTATTEAKPWDFSRVLDLVNSLSISRNSPSTNGAKDGEVTARQKGAASAQQDEHINSTVQKDFAADSSGLGDFSKLWLQLGTPATLSVPAPRALQPSDGDVANFFVGPGYASDSAVRFRTPIKATNRACSRSRNEPEKQETDTASDGSTAPDTPSLTKSQRKKKNRRERKEKEAASVGKKQVNGGHEIFSETELENRVAQQPAKKVEQNLTATLPQQRYESHAKNASDAATKAPKSGPDPLLEAARIAAESVAAAKLADRRSSLSNNKQQPKLATDPKSALTRQNSYPVPSTLPNGASPARNGIQPTAPRNASMRVPQQLTATALHPSTVQPLSTSAPRPAIHYQNPQTPQSAASNKLPNSIRPMIARSGEDRHWALLMKLLGDFYEDRKHLISPMNLTTHNNDPTGIHVFVDASNIFIGFNDQLKRSRGIPQWTQVPSVDLSFDALALLMERRRPVCKRVLAGSTPHLPAFDKAKAVGYECSILEKVYKARELTERQLYFQEHDRHGSVRRRAKAPSANNVATANGTSAGGSGSGSETNTLQYAKPKMIEQGVDEILHLKILESIVDTDAPSTIVLATGDAAQAEYSQGFMAMAERALKKGWTVELVSWSKNISAMYTRKEWTQAWGQRFRVVFLDDYAEELLDM